MTKKVAKRSINRIIELMSNSSCSHHLKLQIAASDGVRLLNNNWRAPSYDEKNINRTTVAENTSLEKPS